MKNNKYFLLVALVAVVIIIESIVLLSNRSNTQSVVSNNSETNPTGEVKEADAVTFDWQNGEKPILVMTANRDVSLDAIDLYINYKNLKVKSVDNVGVLPKPSFSKISDDKSVVVLNYLISDVDGFKLNAGQSVEVVSLDVAPVKTSLESELDVDVKTQVVENGTAKVLPFNSKSLMINSSL